MFLRHPILSVVTLGYLGLVAWLTLTPVSTGFESGLLWRLADVFGRYPATEWFTFMRLEFMANIAMFVPFGVFLVLLFGRRMWWLSIVLGVLMTLGIEFAQQFIPNRVPDTRDLIANALGSVIGAVLALALTASKARLARTRGTPQRASS